MNDININELIREHNKKLEKLHLEIKSSINNLKNEKKHQPVRIPEILLIITSSSLSLLTIFPIIINIIDKYLDNQSGYIYLVRLVIAAIFFLPAIIYIAKSKWTKGCFYILIFSIIVVFLAEYSIKSALEEKLQLGKIDKICNVLKCEKDNNIIQNK